MPRKVPHTRTPFSGLCVYPCCFLARPRPVVYRVPSVPPYAAPRGFRARPCALRSRRIVRAAASKAVTVRGSHLFPSRTEQLSPAAPMVLSARRESRSPPLFFLGSLQPAMAGGSLFSVWLTTPLVPRRVTVRRWWGISPQDGRMGRRHFFLMKPCEEAIPRVFFVFVQW